MIVETDGRRTHGTRQAFERDRRRDLRATLAGWRPIRLTWRQIMRQPLAVGTTIVTLVGRRSGGRA